MGGLLECNLHERCRMFLLRILTNSLPTMMVLWSRIGTGERLCSLCGEMEEFSFHLSKECAFTALGSFWGIKLDEIRGDNVEDLILNGF